MWLFFIIIDELQSCSHTRGLRELFKNSCFSPVISKLVVSGDQWAAFGVDSLLKNIKSIKQFDLFTVQISQEVSPEMDFVSTQNGCCWRFVE